MKKKKVVHIDPEAWAKKCRRRKIVFTVLGILLVIAAVLIYIFRNVVFPAVNYAAAETALAFGDKQGAIDVFASLGNYKDANARAKELAFAEQEDASVEEMLKAAKPGDKIQFGHYEQDAIPQDGKEPISWLVLAEKDGRFLLLSEKVLDVRSFNASGGKTGWATSSIRRWLNGDFYEEAFDENEAYLVIKTKVEASNNPAVGTSGGADTNDRVFLLGYNDLIWIAENGSEDLIDGLYASPTSYAVRQGAEKHYQYGTCCWWLRTPGNDRSTVMYIDMNGSPLHVYRPDKPNYGVRPAIWVFSGDDAEP